MKMIVEYLDRAMQFEHLAAAEDNAELKEQFLKQAADYRKLATKRAAELGLPDRLYSSQSK
jgi:hypothetical protein